MKPINFRLKGLIVQKFGTQADFSKVAGIDECVVSRVVNGRRALSDEDQTVWASLLDANPQDLFGKSR